MSKKKELPVWDREAEYWRAFDRKEKAEAAYFGYSGDDEEEKKKLYIAYVETAKLFEPLYQMREEWMDKTNTRPHVKEKDKLKKRDWLALFASMAGGLLPIAIENRGAIAKSVKENFPKAIMFWK